MTDHKIHLKIDIFIAIKGTLFYKGVLTCCTIISPDLSETPLYKLILFISGICKFIETYWKHTFSSPSALPLFQVIFRELFVRVIDINLRGAEYFASNIKQEKSRPWCKLKFDSSECLDWKLWFLYMSCSSQTYHLPIFNIDLLIDSVKYVAWRNLNLTSSHLTR